MTFISLYRKWRSQIFDEIIGQEHIIRTLKNAISAGRIGHAYLFSGPRGTGKTSTARIFAKALNCVNGPTPNPCGKCDACEKIKNGDAIDVIEIDAASNRGIDEIRDLREKIRFAPVEGRFKVYIIDEVHMLTQEAFNALLKTLEEPPSHVIFVLATTESQKVPVTVASRCQRLDFRRISVIQIEEQLRSICKSEKITIDDQSIVIVARNAEGSMRDAISLLDQLASFCGNKISISDVLLVLGTAHGSMLFDFSASIRKGDVSTVIGLVDKIVLEGKNIPQVAKDLAGFFRNLLVCKVGSEKIIELPKKEIAELKKESEYYTLERIKEIISVLVKSESDMRWFGDARLAFEVAFLNIINIGSENKKIVEDVAISDASGDLMNNLKNSWGDILKKVKTKNVFAYVSLSEGMPDLIGDNKLAIKFKKGFSFHKDRLEERNNKSAVEEAIKEILGRNVTVVGTTDYSDSPDVETDPIENIAKIFNGKKVS